MNIIFIAIGISNSFINLVLFLIFILKKINLLKVGNLSKRAPKKRRVEIVLKNLTS